MSNVNTKRRTRRMRLYWIHDAIDDKYPERQYPKKKKKQERNIARAIKREIK
jgi:hypothetical protein